MINKLLFLFLASLSIFPIPKDITIEPLLQCLIKTKHLRVVKQEKAPVAVASKVKLDTLMQKKDSLFKVWLADTLKTLADPKNNKNDGAFYKKLIKVLPDSLGLNIRMEYNIQVHSKYKSDENIEYLFSLFSQYKEYPESGSNVHFAAVYFYEASPAPDLPYDLIADLDAIKVTGSGKDSISSYGYIRGRLSDKTVTQKAINGSQPTYKVDFIWNDNKLIKKRS